ncbi:MAG: beta-propeller fold lactonase family protein [Leptospirales bacterium]|nr:beta-propeller fold lactonase family protein [Leptospirales bacterium]
MPRLYSNTTSPSGIAQYGFNRETGSIYFVRQSSIGTGAAQLTTDRTGTFAYVADPAANSVHRFLIGPNGALSFIGSVTAAGATKPVSHPTRDLLYVAGNTAASAIHSFSINTADGSLTALGATAAGTANFSTNLTVSNGFVYNPTEASQAIEFYPIGANGILGGRTSFAMAITGVCTNPCEPRDAAVSPDGRFLYSAQFNGAAARAYALNTSTGAIGPALLSDLTTGTAAQNIDVNSSGTMLAVSRATTAPAVHTYNIDPSTGTLTAGTVLTIPTGTFPTFVKFDPTGEFLAAAATGSNIVYVYRIVGGSVLATPVGSASPGMNVTSVGWTGQRFPLLDPASP